MLQSLLTTSDNPFDPFDDWDAWYNWDMLSGYHTPGLLARITVTSTELSESDQDRAIELAMNEILELNVSGVHMKVTREIPEVSPTPA
jgi:hypothetical protein